MANLARSGGGRFEQTFQIVVVIFVQTANGCRFAFQDGFHDYLALRIHHRYAHRCLMIVQPNILFTVYKCAPFRRCWCDNHNLPQEGRPLIMRFQQL